ncbi:MAG: hypothetical protein LBS10_10775 [Gracilibacteraceae bacterium]|nr:hypothetical protein [Gracilibacteraceae bacterium]
MKKFYLGLLVLILLALAATAVLELPALTGGQTPPPAMELLRVSNLTGALYDAGLPFTVAPDYDGAFSVNGLAPALVTFYDDQSAAAGDMVLVYECHSLPEYEDLVTAIYRDGALSGLPGLSALGPGDWRPTTLTAKNLLLIYLSRADLLPRYAERQAQNLEILTEAVAARLNRTRRVFYLGEGEQWAVRIVMDYYRHTWLDENGREEIEFHYEQTLGLKALGESDAALSLRLTLTSGADDNSADLVFDPARADSEGYVWFAGLSGDAVFDLEAPFSALVSWAEQREDVPLRLYVEDGAADAEPAR